MRVYDTVSPVLACCPAHDNDLINCMLSLLSSTLGPLVLLFIPHSNLMTARLGLGVARVVLPLVGYRIVSD